ncbi:MAG: galactitol-1-phosphate 5-dehydrogenase [Terracidiphilus sp.]
MRALLLEKYNELKLEDVPIPEFGHEDMLIRVKACGICGSDVHGYDGSTGRRIPPLIMGHEAAGIVHSAGRNVQSFKPGDRVTFDSTISCGACRFCAAGAVNLCEKRQVLGVSCGEYRRNGAFAEYVSVPARIVYALPDEFSFAHAALIEAVSVAVHAAKITAIRPGSTAVVIGAGMIGLLSVQTFRHYGCDRVFAVDVDETRLKMARDLGATDTFLGSGSEIVSRVLGVTDGRGAEIAVEAVGAQEPITTAIECVCSGGTVTLIGNVSPRVEIPLQRVVSRQLRLLGSCASAGEYPECISLMQKGAIRVEPLISAVAPLSDAAGWFERLHAHEPGLMKVVLEP